MGEGKEIIDGTCTRVLVRGAAVYSDVTRPSLSVSLLSHMSWSPRSWLPCTASQGMLKRGDAGSFVPYLRRRCTYRYECAGCNAHNTAHYTLHIHKARNSIAYRTANRTCTQTRSVTRRLLVRRLLFLSSSHRKPHVYTNTQCTCRAILFLSSSRTREVRGGTLAHPRRRLLLLPLCSSRRTRTHVLTIACPTTSGERRRPCLTGRQGERDGYAAWTQPARSSQGRVAINPSAG